MLSPTQAEATEASTARLKGWPEKIRSIGRIAQKFYGIKSQMPTKFRISDSRPAPRKWMRVRGAILSVVMKIQRSIMLVLVALQKHQLLQIPRVFQIEEIEIAGQRELPSEPCRSEPTAHVDTIGGLKVDALIWNYKLDAMLVIQTLFRFAFQCCQRHEQRKWFAIII